MDSRQVCTYVCTGMYKPACPGLVWQKIREPLTFN